MNKPRVLLADDHTLVLDGFQKLLETHCELVGTAEDGRAVVEAAERLKPDLVLLDIAMPRLNGIEAARKLKKQHPDMKIIFVTCDAAEQLDDAALRLKRRIGARVHDREFGFELGSRPDEGGGGHEGERGGGERDGERRVARDRVNQDSGGKPRRAGLWGSAECCTQAFSDPQQHRQQDDAGEQGAEKADSAEQREVAQCPGTGEGDGEEAVDGGDAGGEEREADIGDGSAGGLAHIR